ncbi:MAG: hypothetical protein IPJ61_07930 [Tessaracoccus sp.]|nr:hypothetical protein [Tessaracoccus sp.]
MFRARHQEIVATLSRQLRRTLGRGFGRSNLHRMVTFARAFPQAEAVGTLVATIELEPLRGAYSRQGPPRRGLLRGPDPRRASERPCAQGTHRPSGVRAQ